MRRWQFVYVVAMMNAILMAARHGESYWVQHLVNGLMFFALIALIISLNKEEHVK